MLLILKIIKIFKKCYHSVVVMWQHMSSVPVMRTVWRREPAHIAIKRRTQELREVGCEHFNSIYCLTTPNGTS
jgi:hypothetical protein